MNGNSSTSIIVVGFLVLCFLVGSCSNNDSYVPSSDNSSFEHRYAKERVKLEGYSNADAETAARAVVKFHETQKKRKKF